MRKEKDNPNVLIFRGVNVNNKSGKLIETPLKEVKNRYNYPTIAYQVEF